MANDDVGCVAGREGAVRRLRLGGEVSTVSWVVRRGVTVTRPADMPGPESHSGGRRACEGSDCRTKIVRDDGCVAVGSIVDLLWDACSRGRLLAAGADGGCGEAGRACDDGTRRDDGASSVRRAV